MTDGKLTDHMNSVGMLKAIEEVTTKFQLCRNRVWAVIKTLQPADRDHLLKIPSLQDVPHRATHIGHDQCTFDFCEHSRLDFTSVGQRHECTNHACESRWFEPHTLEQAAQAGKPTAWTLDGKSMIESPQPFMALSHVWSDGTGSGAWPPGQVNSCLYEFFKGISEQFQCEGIWWDTICIPKEKAARSKAVINIQRNYEDARITVVHDCFLRGWDWVNGETACFAIIMSPWFSRGWTALELARSRKVKVLFRGPRGPVIKDLDQDILAKRDEPSSIQHQIATNVIAALRARGIAELNQLLAVLGPRHTSWPRDMAIISGQLAGIKINPAASQQSIYQEVLKKIGSVSHAHLFHNSAPMSKGFSWCPTTIFDMPQSLTYQMLEVLKNGEVSGTWAVFTDLNRIPDERFNWKGMHPLIYSKLRSALSLPEKHLLLVIPENALRISEGLVVRIIKDEDESHSLKVQYVGPVYYQPPLGREELGDYTIRFGRGNEGQVIIGDVDEPEMTTYQSADLLKAAADGNTELVRTLFNRKTNFKVRDEDQKTALHLAAQNGHKDVVQLLASKTKRNLKDKDRKTPLHWAAQNGHEVSVELLLKNGADPDLQDQDSWTALHYTVWRGFEKVVRSLAGKAKLNVQDRLGQTPLHLAAERGNVEIMRTLLEKLPDSKPLAVRCNDGQTVLHRAAWGGSEMVVRLLLDRTQVINSAGKDKQTALHIAAEKGFTSVVDLLLQHGASWNRQDSKEQTALHLAAENGHDDVVELLLKVDTDLKLEDINGWTPLLLAVRNGHEGVVGILLQHGAEVDSKNQNGRTPLLWAAGRGHKGVVKLLVAKGASLEYRDSNSQTALLSAAENGHVEVVELLLKEGALLESKDSSGQTPLLWAAERGHEAVVNLLIEMGADVEIKDGKGQTPLLSAAKNGHVVVVKLLVGKGAHLESKDEHDRTPLMWASRMGHEDVVKVLLENGADFESTDKENETALSLAAERHEAVVKVLLENGDVASKDKGGEILRWAAIKGNAAIVELLLNGDGVNIEYKSNRGRTPLHYATERGYQRVVQVLVEHGADLKWKDKDGHTPLSLAFENENGAILKLLLENGAELESKEQGGQILVWALSEGHEDLALLLLKKGAAVESRDRNGRTPLSWAAEKGYLGVVKRLLEKRAKLESRDNNDNFPLWYAAEEGNGAVIKLLLKKGANLEASTNGMTALVPAMARYRTEAIEVLLKNGAEMSNKYLGSQALLWGPKNGYEEVVEQLLKKTADGINPDEKDMDDRTGLSWAVEMGFEKVAILLIENGAQIESKDKHGQTPLFYAAGNADVTMVKLLIENGAQVDTRDNYGRTALSRAEAHGRKAVVKFLLENGSGVTIA